MGGVRRRVLVGRREEGRKGRCGMNDVKASMCLPQLDTEGTQLQYLLYTLFHRWLKQSQALEALSTRLICHTEILALITLCGDYGNEEQYAMILTWLYGTLNKTHFIPLNMDLVVTHKQYRIK